VSRLVLLALVILFALAGPAGGRRAPTVVLHPGVVRLGQHAAIAVSPIDAPSVDVRLSGATDIAGRPLPWISLHRSGSGWVGNLPAPALRGVYPVELRIGHGAEPFRSGSALRIFPRGARVRPSFATPTGAVRWWVRAVAGAQLVAVKAWPRPAFDRRDVRLHRLFVVAYSPAGKPAGRDRLGMFVEVFRDGDGARWRFLEATVVP
jgi:hypothetical protein